MPGKQNYSLAITWALDHDPVQVVQDLLSGEVFEEAVPAQNGAQNLPAEGGTAMKSLKIRKSRSLEDAAKVRNEPFLRALTTVHISVT